MLILNTTITNHPDDIHAPKQLQELLNPSNDQMNQQRSEIVKSGKRKYEVDGNDEFTTLDSVDAEFIRPEVPSQIARMGAMRRIRSILETGSEYEKEVALNSVKDTLANDPSFAYANVLAARHGIWNEQSDGLDNFSLAFEVALREKNTSSLEELSKKYPRFKALTIVALAIFGDEPSANIITSLFSAGDEALHPGVRVLKLRMSPYLKAINGGLSAKDVVKTNASEMLLALYDSNEAGLYESSIAA